MPPSLSDKTVPVFYCDTHNFHNPPFEYDRGFQIPYQEVPRRIEAAKESLGALAFTNLLTPSEPLPESVLLSIHSAALLNYLKQTSDRAAAWQQSHPEQGEVYNTPWIYPLNTLMRQGLLNSPDPSGCFAFDVYAPVGKHTWSVVYANAGLAYAAAHAVLHHGAQLTYALCRPPGHHAGVDYTGGYCYLNNAALAAQCLTPLGQGAILDIDYHHGNGTQEIFWQRSDVLYVSIHADPSQEYPFFSGFSAERGGENAPTSTLNLPLPMHSGDAVYLRAVEKALETIRKMGAKWLVLSAGYDTCADDPTTTFTVSDSMFSLIGERINKLKIPVVVVHEGGYAVEANGRLSARLLQGLFG